MADREVQVPANQNVQAAQAAAVLNQPPPPPPQNPEEPPANSQNAAAEEVSLEVCLFFVLTLFCFPNTCCLHRGFSSFSSRVVMPCVVTYSFIVTVLGTKLNFLSGLFSAVHMHRLFLLRPMLNCTVLLSTLPQNVLFFSFGGNLAL